MEYNERILEFAKCSAEEIKKNRDQILLETDDILYDLFKIYELDLINDSEMVKFLTNFKREGWETKTEPSVHTIRFLRYVSRMNMLHDCFGNVNMEGEDPDFTGIPFDEVCTRFTVSILMNGM